MKKYYLQVIVASALIGIIVRIVNQCMMELPLDTNVSNYIKSIFIGVMCGSVTMTIYIRFLIHNQWQRWMKYVMSYIVISIVYFAISLLLSGTAYLNDLYNYILLVVILILATPVIFMGEKGYSIYYEGLKRRKAMNALKKK